MSPRGQSPTTFGSALSPDVPHVAQNVAKGQQETSRELSRVVAVYLVGPSLEHVLSPNRSWTRRAPLKLRHSRSF